LKERKKMSFIDEIEKFKLSKKFKYIYFGILCVLFPLVITIYGIVYFGGLWDPIGKIKYLKVSIVNDDEGCPNSNVFCLVLSTKNLTIPNLGSMIKNNIETNEKTKDIFDWELHDFENENGADKEKLSYEIVDKYDRWGVIYIPKNFTQNVLSQMDKSPYQSQEAQKYIFNLLSQKYGVDPTKLNMKDLTETRDATIFYIYDTARSYTSVSFVTTAFESIDKGLKKSLALQMYEIGTKNGAAFNNNFYLNAYVTNFVDIHPLRNFGQNFASFMLFVIIYVSAIATNLVYRKYRPFNYYIQDEKTNTSIFISAFCKICINMMYMLIVCAFMMIVMFMFGDAQHENNVFCIYLIFVLWAFICLSYCHVVSNLLPLLPFLGISVITLVVQLATCGGIIANKLQPSFWNIGKALPLYYATAEMKFILFDTGRRFSGRNILALLLWAVGLSFLDILTNLAQLNNVRRQAPQGAMTMNSMEKQDKSNRVTKEMIEKNSSINNN